MPLHVFNVTVTVARQWGDPQQVSLDTLLHWSARLSPKLGIKLLDAVRAVVQETLPGALAPITESGAAALEALGKDKQLQLPVVCQVADASEKQ